MTNPATHSTGATPSDLLVPEVPESLSGVLVTKLALRGHIRMRLVRLGFSTIGHLEGVTEARYLKASGAKAEDIPAIRESLASLAGIPIPERRPEDMRPAPPVALGIAPVIDGSAPVLPADLPDDVLDATIDELGLATSMRNGLVGYGFATLRDMRPMTEHAFASLCLQLGKPTIDAVRSAAVRLASEGRRPGANTGVAPAPRPTATVRRTSAPTPRRSPNGFRTVEEGSAEALAGRPVSGLDLKPSLMRVVLGLGVADLGELCGLGEADFLAGGGDRFSLLTLRHAIRRAADSAPPPPARTEARPRAPAVPTEPPRPVAASPTPVRAAPAGEAALLPAGRHGDEVLDLPLAGLDLAPATRGALALLGCKTVRDLQEVTIRQFMTCRGVGIKSVDRLRAAIPAAPPRGGRALSGHVGVARGNRPAYGIGHPVRPLIEADLARLPPSDSLVLAAALGIGGQALAHPSTVQACCGPEERAALAACAEGSAWQGPLSDHLLGLVHRTPLTLSDLAARPWAQGMPEVAVARLVNLLVSPGLSVFASRGSDAYGFGAAIVSPVPRTEWEGCLAKAWALIEGDSGRLTAGDTAGAVWDAFHPHPVHVRTALVEAIFNGTVPSDPTSALVGPGEMRDTVRAVLESSAEPMPLAAVADGVREALGASVPRERLIATLGEVAYHAHGGGYGSLSVIEAAGGSARIAQAVLGIMAKSPVAKWATGRMATQLLPRMRVTPHALRHALEGDPRFAWYGGTSFGPVRHVPPQPQSLQAAAASILASEGRPMSVRDLVKGLMRIRGEGRLPVEDGNLFRLDAQRWGLVERDIPVPDECVRACVAAVASLDLTGPTSLGQVLKAIRPKVPGSEAMTENWLGAVLKASGAYEVGQGRTVRRTDLSPVANGVIGERVQGVLAEAGDPMTARQVALAVGDLIGRFPDERTVRLALMAKGVPDGQGGETTWTLRGGDAPTGP